MEHDQLAGVSGGLSPLEIKNKEFSRTVWGYSPEQVVSFLDQVAKAWEKVQAQEKRLLETIAALNQEVLKWEKREAQLDQMKEEATRQAEAIRAAAEKDAKEMFEAMEAKSQDIRQKTEVWLESVLGEVEQVERQKMNFVTALKSALDSHYELLNEDGKTKVDAGERLNAFLKSQNVTSNV